MNTRHRFTVTLILMIASSLATSDRAQSEHLLPGQADDPTQANPESDGDESSAARSTAKAIGERLLPQLGGHRFTPTQIDMDPFITTYFRTATGIGVVIDAETRFGLADSLEWTLQGDLLVLLVDVEYQHAVTEWLSLRGLFTATARTGTNEQSLVGLGLSSLDGFELGAKLRAWKSDRAMLAGSIEIRRARVFLVSPARYAEELLEQGFRVSENGLLAEASAQRYTGALRFAYAPADWIGLLGMVEGGVANPSVEQVATETVFATSVTVDVDLVPLVSVPLGVLSTYLYDSYPANGDDLAKAQRNFSVGVSYTGRDEFAVGFELTRGRLQLLETDTSISVNSVRAKLRYFF
jgi:hypothetical protein